VIGIDGEIEIFVGGAVTIIVQPIAIAFEFWFMGAVIATVPRPLHTLRNAPDTHPLVDAGDTAAGRVDVFVCDLVTVVVDPITKFDGTLMNVRAAIIAIRAETIARPTVSVTVLVFTGNAASTIGIADGILFHIAAMSLGTRLDATASGTRSAVSEIDASIISSSAVRVDVAGLALDAAFDDANGDVTVRRIGGPAFPAQWALRVVPAEGGTLPGTLGPGNAVLTQAIFVVLTRAEWGPHWWRRAEIGLSVGVSHGSRPGIRCIDAHFDLEKRWTSVQHGGFVITRADDTPSYANRDGPTPHPSSPESSLRQRVATGPCWGEERC